jgi:ribosomal protein L12E/L44/L45/RPP1/RPP2
MQITVPAKLIKEAIQNKIEYDVDYSSATLKAAGITPSKLLATVTTDEAYLAKLEKYIVKNLDFEDVLYEAAMETYCPMIAAAVKACNKIQDAADKAERKQREDQAEQERVKQTIEALTKMGYKITKA